MKLLAIVFLITILSSCGGGGGSSSNNQPGNSDNEQTSGGGKDDNTDSGTTTDGETGKNSNENLSPIVDAGVDQEADEKTVVSLLGNASDADGTIINYEWKQISGSSAIIENVNSAGTKISIPEIPSDEEFVFQLKVTDDDGAIQLDEVSVAIKNVNDIVILNDSDTAPILSRSEEVLSVEEGTALAENEVGDIVIADPSDDFPNGLFVKLVEKTTENGVTTFITKQPPLKEVIQEGALSIASDFVATDFSEMSTTPAPNGMKIYVKNENYTYSKLSSQKVTASKVSSLLRQKRSQKEIPWDPQVFQGCESPSHMSKAPEIILTLEDVGLYQNIKKPEEEPIFDTGALNLADDEDYKRVIGVDGCMGMNFGYELIIDFNAFSSDHYKFTVHPEQYGELKLSGKLAEEELEINKELHKWVLPRIKGAIGVVPIWITPEITIMWGLNAKAGATIFTGISEYAGVEFGIEYRDETLNPIIDSNFDFDYQPPKIALYAEAESYIGPNFALKIYDVVGPNADLQLYANALVQNEQPWWKVSVGARIGAGIKVELFGEEIEELTFTIPDILDKEIASWEAKTPPLDIPSGLHGVASNTTVDVSWDTVPGATGYSVYWDDKPELDISSSNIDTELTSAVIENLDSGKVYYFSVVAKGYEVASGFSDTLIVETTEEISIPSDGAVKFSGNGHYYEFVSANLSWDEALLEASRRAFNGKNGYLVTITSEEENNFVSNLIKGKDGIWLGASDRDSEGAWKWQAGPESGLQFWQGGKDGTAVDSAYSNWNLVSQPAPSTASQEDYANMPEPSSPGYNGKWADGVSSSALSYVVEYEPDTTSITNN